MSEITIYFDRKIGRVNPFIFGQNVTLESGKIFWQNSKYSSDRNFRKDVIEATKRIKIPIIRWPGGNFASAYHWENGVGPKENRPVIYELAWGEKESNQFGTNELIEFCHLIGAEPFITVNLSSGTSEEAAHWVEYCNMGETPIESSKNLPYYSFFNRNPTERRNRRKLDPWYLNLPYHTIRSEQIGRSYYAKLREEHCHPEPYNVKYWSIGNETWGLFQVGTLSAEENAKKTLEFAKLMKRVDPNIKIAAVGNSLGGWELGGFGDEKTDLDWNLQVLRTAGKLIDYISIHRYYPSERGKYLPLMATPIHSERKILVLNSLIDVVMDLIGKEERIEISYDEWSLGIHTLAEALASARFFNVLQRMSNSVTIACGEQWITSILEDDILFEATHLTFDLYENYTGEIALETSVETKTYDTEVAPSFGGSPQPFKAVPYIDSSTTLSEDGERMYIATVNVHKNEGESCEIRIKGASVKKRGRIFELNGPDIMAYNEPQNPNNVKITEKKLNNARNVINYEFPPHSATIIELYIQ